MGHWEVGHVPCRCLWNESTGVTVGFQKRLEWGQPLLLEAEQGVVWKQGMGDEAVQLVEGAKAVATQTCCPCKGASHPAQQGQHFCPWVPAGLCTGREPGSMPGHFLNGNIWRLFLRFLPWIPILVFPDSWATETFPITFPGSGHLHAWPVL